MGVTSHSAFKQGTNEKLGKCAQTKTATSVIESREDTRGSEDEEMIVGLPERFHEQRVEDMVRSARENAESRDCRQGRRKACLHGL